MVQRLVFSLLAAFCVQIALAQDVHPDIGKTPVCSDLFFYQKFRANFQPEMIARRGYPVETHFVTTIDGYVLQMHRIPQPGKPVAYLQHGSLSSSADWILMGPESSLGMHSSFKSIIVVIFKFIS
jgi:hypothetical protein